MHLKNKTKGARILRRSQRPGWSVCLFCSSLLSFDCNLREGKHSGRACVIAMHSGAAHFQSELADLSTYVSRCLQMAAVVQWTEGEAFSYSLKHLWTTDILRGIHGNLSINAALRVNHIKSTFLLCWFKQIYWLKSVWRKQKRLFANCQTANYYSCQLLLSMWSGKVIWPIHGFPLLIYPYPNPKLKKYKNIFRNNHLYSPWWTGQQNLSFIFEDCCLISSLDWFETAMLITVRTDRNAIGIPVLVCVP